MGTFRDQTLVLTRNNQGEYDVRYTLFCKKHGKVIAVAKSARKIKSKLAGSLEPPVMVDLLLAPGKYYHHLAGAESLENFKNIRQNLLALSLTNYLLQLTEIILPLEQPEGEIYHILSKVLGGLNNFSQHEFNKKIVLAATVWYKVNLLNLLGTAAQANQEDIDESSRDFFKKLSQTSGFEVLLNNKISIKALQNKHQLLDELVLYEFSRQIPSRKFIQSMFE